MDPARTPLLEQPGLWAGLAAVAIALVWWRWRRRQQRLVQLEREVRTLAGSALPFPHGDPDDAIGRVRRAVHLMSEDLRRRIDVLERDRAERERIVAHMSDGVALLDGSNRILRANHSLGALLGMPLPPVPGTPLREVLRAPEVDALVGRARSLHHAVDTEFRPGGHDPRIVTATATPLGPSASDSLLLVLHDRTEEERTLRVRQDFVANVSHELRTPLTSLRGYAETLLEGGLEDAENREGFVRVIRDQAVRLAALIDDLLSLAALEAPGSPLRIEHFDLRELAEQSVRTMAPRAEQAGLGLSLVPGEPVPVAADRARLEQVVANLVDNALKYTERGSVTLRVGTGDRGAWCEIADTGPGIPLEDQPRIFERFYRVDKARSREKGGTGLGLSIVRHILSLHGGQVSVRSKPGQGSVFRVELPPAAPRHAVTSPS